MSIRLFEIQNDEFPEIVQCFYESFRDPGTKLWDVFGGDYRPEEPEYHAAALKSCTERLISWHRADPTSHWLKVVDESTGKVAGGGRWSFYKKGRPNPYDEYGRMEADWFPEGEPREMATKLLDQFLAGSRRNINRPHACTYQAVKWVSCTVL